MTKNEDYSLPNLIDDQPSGYRTHSDKRLSVTVTHKNGAQDIGRHAVKQLLRVMQGKEPSAPQGPDDHLIVTKYEDGSFDTGTRAVRNAIRAARGKERKVYKRTYHPID